MFCDFVLYIFVSTIAGFEPNFKPRDGHKQNNGHPHKRTNEYTSLTLSNVKCQKKTFIKRLEHCGLLEELNDKEPSDIIHEECKKSYGFSDLFKHNNVPD